MFDMDMYDYVVNVAQPPLVVKVGKPKDPPPAKPPTPAQIKAKEMKERDELRSWWAGLPESERQAIREKQFPVKPKKKKPVKCECCKDCGCHKENKPADPPKKEEPKLEKPDINSYQGPQQWAIVEM